MRPDTNAGQNPAELEQHDIYISHRAFIQLLEDAADELRCPDFGLRRLHPQALDVLGPTTPPPGDSPGCPRRPKRDGQSSQCLPGQILRSLINP